MGPAAALPPPGSFWPLFWADLEVSALLFPGVFVLWSFSVVPFFRGCNFSFVLKNIAYVCDFFLLFCRRFALSPVLALLALCMRGAVTRPRVL